MGYICDKSLVTQYLLGRHFKVHLTWFDFGLSEETEQSSQRKPHTDMGEHANITKPSFGKQTHDN